MKTTMLSVVVLLGLHGLSNSASAQYYPPIGGYYRNPYCNVRLPQAPDACGPGFYCLNKCGCVYGPNYYLRPPFPPHNGMVFAPHRGGPGGPGGAGAGAGVFQHHAFARSPRDFFMEDVP